MLSKDRIEVIEAAIVRAKRYLNEYPGDPGMAVVPLRDLPETEEAELGTLAYLLESGHFGCHKNDVLGLIEFLQRWVDDNSPEQNAGETE